MRRPARKGWTVWAVVAGAVVVLAVGGYVSFRIYRVVAGSRAAREANPVTIHHHARPAERRPVVLFVHGIGGDALETWKDGDSPSFMELLGTDPDLEGYGVFSVDYNTSIVGSADRVTDVARKIAEQLDEQFHEDAQVVVVAHSLGGVLMRLALHKSRFRERSHQFLTMITLASPFQGSRLPDAADELPPLPWSEQLEVLTSDSELLALINHDWDRLVESEGHRIQQYALYETVEMPGVPLLVVGQESAGHGIDPHDVLPAEGTDHRTIAKPRDLSGGVGKQVKAWILASTGRLTLGPDVGPFDEDVDQPAGSEIRILPGTRLVFRNGAILSSRGPVFAMGTREAPVIFEFEDAGGDACVLLRGPETNGSFFRHCTFRGGRGVRLEKPNPKRHKEKGKQELYGDAMTRRLAEARSVGGAVTLVQAYNLRFEDCRFEGNRAYTGGAFSALGSDRITLERCDFEGNESAFGGGAIYAQVSELVLKGCTFRSNRTGETVAAFAEDPNAQYACGGAIYCGELTLLDLRSGRFFGNEAANAGGAVYLYDTTSRKVSLGSPGFLVDSVFEGNRSYLKEGAAIRLDGYTRVSLTGVVLRDNEWEGRGVRAQLWDETDLDPDREEQTSGVVDLRVEWWRTGEQVEEGYRPVKPPPRPEVHLSPIAENAYRSGSERAQKVDTVVLHHISAINWHEEGFREQFSEALHAFEEASGVAYAPEGRDEYKYDWRLCKQILELYGVSAHFLIDREGEIHQLVGEEFVAYHAGGSIMPEPDDRRRVNEFSIGIELVSSHPDDDEQVRSGAISAYTNQQYESLSQLLLHLLLKYDVPLRNVVGHEDVAGERAVALGLRPSPKKDPGPMFDWERVRLRLEGELVKHPSYTGLPR